MPSKCGYHEPTSWVWMKSKSQIDLDITIITTSATLNYRMTRESYQLDKMSNISFKVIYDMYS